MSNGSIFAAQVAEFVAKAKGNADLVVRKIALEMFARVIVKSPVDTGRFKSNWQVSINSVPSGTLPFATADEHRDKTARKSKERSAHVEAPTIARVQQGALSVKAGEIIYLVNNLVYALALEYGHSKQAPQGMVRLTIVEFQGVVDAAAGSLPK